MTVCTEWAQVAPSRVAPQEFSRLLSLQKQLGTRAFLLLSCPGGPAGKDPQMAKGRRKKGVQTMKDNNIPYKI